MELSCDECQGRFGDIGAVWDHVRQWRWPVSQRRGTAVYCSASISLAVTDKRYESSPYPDSHARGPKQARVEGIRITLYSVYNVCFLCKTPRHFNQKTVARHHTPGLRRYGRSRLTTFSTLH